MSWTQAGAAAVVVAQQFNPSVVTQIWLLNNHILAGDDFLDGSIYTDFVVQVRSRPFHMLVLQDQLQFVPAVEVPVAEQEELIVAKLGAIIQLLPHTPYRALGLNFSWHLTPARDDIGAFSRRLFGLAPAGVYRATPVAGRAVGSYSTGSPLPDPRSPGAIGGVFSVALSVTRPSPAECLAVSQYLA